MRIPNIPGLFVPKSQDLSEARRLRLGDLVEKMAKPIAKALRLDCIDKDGSLKPDSGCAKRRDALNRLTNPALLDGQHSEASNRPPE